LARAFRYYGKKRGNRRTTSSKAGIIGEAVAFAVCLALGCAGVVLAFSDLVVPDWRVNHDFVATTCTVLEKRVGEKVSPGDALLKIEYEVAGTTYRPNVQAPTDRFQIYSRALKNRYPCWYDPANPSTVVLVREYHWMTWLVFTMPISFIIIGAGGLLHALWHWGRSAERRAALAQRVQPRELLGGNGDRPYPYVPEGADMTNSPGTKLKFRLPMTGSPGWALFGMLVFCVAWNGTVAFAAIAIGRHRTGLSAWLLALFVVLFALVGLGAFGLFVRRLALTMGAGPTRLEISDHPLRPGGQYRVFLPHAGRKSMKSLSLWLLCEESATYRQGTNARTETREVYRQELFRRDDFPEQDGRPFETVIELVVPPCAMHSFAAEHNEIQWKLAVEASEPGRANRKRAFPVIVCPAGGEPTR
jgi:hypothetical protein